MFNKILTAADFLSLIIETSELRNGTVIVNQKA